MNYQDFIIQIKEKVQAILGNNIRIEIMNTVKNNGYERFGLSISSQNINISPTIYLEEFFEQYQCQISMDIIAQDIADLYNEVRFENNLNVDTIQNFSEAKSYISYKLINYEKNSFNLDRLPHKKYLDFAIVYFIFFETEPCCWGSILITNDLMKYWNTTQEELHQIAEHNTPHLLPLNLKPLHDMLYELSGHSDWKDFEENPLYILTNEYRTFGAAAILYNNVLETIYEEIKENYYLIPSSIHEFIIVPESRSPEKELLTKMVHEINISHVSTEEMLADTVYYYDSIKNSAS